MKENTRSKGPQPLDRLMTELAITNHDLTESSEEQLTHKMVAKGRKGRELTMNAQMKILNALNACRPEGKYKLSDLFNYSGR